MIYFKVNIDDSIEGKLIEITMLQKIDESTKVIERFNMAPYDRFVTSVKNGIFCSQRLARFRTWKTVDGNDLNPHKNLKKGKDKCDFCQF